MDKTAFQLKIFDWWKMHKRDLPWRHTHDPYKILVSETMLQQTQVIRVVEKYKSFIYRYPSTALLANASLGDIVKIWQGLGYNRRAKYLHMAAKIIEDKFSGVFPTVESELLSLPGVGLYTARAIQVFAFNSDVAAVDTNIKQILEQNFFNSSKQSQKTIQNLADQLVPLGRSWEWHQALMDYGALELVRTKHPKKPSIPFIQSNRFLRGRIIDLLRTHSFNESDLKNHLQTLYNKTDEEVTLCISTLSKDGLLVRSKDRISLP